MIIQKIMLVALLIINVLLLLSVAAYIALRFYMWKHKDELPTKSEWKIME